MLTVRYSTMFSPRESANYLLELLLSLVTLEASLEPFADLEVVFYVRSADENAWKATLDLFSFDKRLIAPETSAEWEHDVAFARTIKTCHDLDRICIIRMLNDFRCLPRNNHRLLVGTDIFFVKPPDEILEFCWKDIPSDDVVYLADVWTFRGQPYTLKMWFGTIAKGLLGDFYCLAPDIHLSSEAIRSCLRLIDTWPLDGGRYEPDFSGPNTQVEQMAAAILLGSYRTRMLPSHRYSHMVSGSDTVVYHSHDLTGVQKHLAPPVLERYKFVLQRVGELLA